MSFPCECFVLTGRGLCVRLITHPGVLQSAVCLSVIVKPQQRGGLGTRGAVSPWKIKISTLQGNLKFIVLVIT
jgi:hypothetical protein